ncbi:YIP1 family protein [Paenibacillus sp. J5C_2022]|uniref:YIP1 family protein n=1 Tax=Paenibacillus sp. J5C2022 TaxID=2977129 RepID=UPI0021D3EBE4|nr:YIP1 family protein [Paenibacillus sp. J5C2022]MCU6711598.1 YIP1 family protein [Paenibacillus sp. J5C2022]
MNRNHNRGKRLAAVRIGVWLCVLALLSPPLASADYPSVFVDHSSFMRKYIVQPVYLPDRAIDLQELEIPLQGPSDLFAAENGDMYIADTGNNRIVQLNSEGGFIRSIGDADGPGKLDGPEGVFVDSEGAVYAANTGGGTIVKFAPNGTVMGTFGKPESNLLGEDYYFKPTKLVVDARGVMYVVAKDTYQGLLRMNSEGEFTGFFGANKTKLTALDRLKRLVLNREQLAKEVAKRPNSLSNVSIAEDGFYLTTSIGFANDGQIKKLNAGGFDAFGNKPFEEWDLVDAAIDGQGYIYGIDRKEGYVTIYDPMGEPLFYFGGVNRNVYKLGTVNYATSIAIGANHELWVADSSVNAIHVFKRTSFGDRFLTAAHYYYEGDYEASKQYWDAVIAENGMMNMSFNGLGKIALREGDYRTALAYFKQSNDAEGYSDAYWSIRYEWLQRYFLVMLLALAVLIWGGRWGWKRLRSALRKVDWPPAARRYGEELKDACYVMLHPYEGFYRLKERRISLVVIAFILALALLSKLLSIFAAGFIARPYDIGWVNVKVQLGMLVLPWLTWVLANYLVSTVKGGEGRFREVLQGSTYAVMPYAIITLISIPLTNVLVLEEWIIIDLLRTVMWIWVVVLLFVMTQVIHNFDFLETFKNGGVTLFTIGVIWIFVIIFIALGANLMDFASAVYQEVKQYG